MKKQHIYLFNKKKIDLIINFVSMKFINISIDSFILIKKFFNDKIRFNNEKFRKIDSNISLLTNLSQF